MDNIEEIPQPNKMNQAVLNEKGELVGWKEGPLPYPWCWKPQACRKKGRCLGNPNCGD